MNMNFKGPLQSRTYKCLFVVINEFSCFPFANPCKDTSLRTIIQCLESIFSLTRAPNYLHSDQSLVFLVSEVNKYQLMHAFSFSKTTPYHPQGNAEVECYNGIIWKTICLTLKSHNLPLTHWELVLLCALHSIRSVMSTATNTTLHERFFSFFWWSSIGISLLSWLLKPGPVFLCQFVRHSKNDPLVQEVELLDMNSTYTHIRYGDGHESTILLHDLAPYLSQTLMKKYSEVDTATKERPHKETAFSNWRLSCWKAEQCWYTTCILWGIKSWWTTILSFSERKLYITTLWVANLLGSEECYSLLLLVIPLLTELSTSQGLLQLIVLILYGSKWQSDGLCIVLITSIESKLM